MAQDREKETVHVQDHRQKESHQDGHRDKESHQDGHREKKEKSSEHHEEPPPPIDETPVLTQSAGGRTYYITLPIRPMSGHIPEEALDRLTLYYTLYGVVFAVVGAISIVLPLVFGVAVPTLLAWLLVLGGSVTLLMFLLICGAPGTTAFLLLSGLHMSAGLYLLVQPVDGTTALTFLLSGWFLAHGLLKIFMAIAVRKITTWPVVLVSGITSMVLAFVIVVLTPRFGLRLLSITFGGDLAFTGISLLLISMMGFLGKGHRSVTDADHFNEPLLRGGGHAASSA